MLDREMGCCVTAGLERVCKRGRGKSRDHDDDVAIRKCPKERRERRNDAAWGCPSGRIMAQAKPKEL